jgi:hypothetical protein
MATPAAAPGEGRQALVMDAEILADEGVDGHGDEQRQDQRPQGAGGNSDTARAPSQAPMAAAAAAGPTMGQGL